MHRIVLVFAFLAFAGYARRVQTSDLELPRSPSAEGQKSHRKAFQRLLLALGGETAFNPCGPGGHVPLGNPTSTSSCFNSIERRHHLPAARRSHQRSRVPAVRSFAEALVGGPQELFDIDKLTYEEVHDMDADRQDGLLKTLKYEDPQANLKACQLLATVYVCFEETDTAVYYAKMAMQNGGEDSEMHFVLGYASECKGQVNEALEEYDKALELDPDYWRAHYQAGRVAMVFRFAEEAYEEFQAVLESNPNHKPTLKFFQDLNDRGITDGEAFQKSIDAGEPAPYDEGMPSVNAEPRTQFFDKDPEDPKLKLKPIEEDEE